MKPKKYIKLYHLGHLPPIANFEEHQEEAVFCLQQLNKKVLLDAGGAFNVNALLKRNFYYLAGEEEEGQFCHYVDMANADNIQRDARFLVRILSEDGTRAAPVIPIQPDEKPPIQSGGRNNKKNRRKF
jgi:hypothetical protein